MQPAIIFSHVSAAATQPVGPAVFPCRSETQYGNEIRYLRKIIHASLATLEQAGAPMPSRRGDGDLGGLKVA